MSAHEDVLHALESFVDDGWISEVLFEVKSGKEATVYCCRAGARAQPHNLIATKVHRALENRRFKNDAIYQTGRMHLARNGRVKRAAEAKSDFGRKIQYATWIDNEWETLNVLFEAGADVVQPLSRNDRAILMPYLGDEVSPAPNLNEADLDSAQARRIADRLIWNIGLMLDHDRVHGDLSPFNVLYWNARATIIDFPQAIDPRLNPSARVLLERDIENICRWATKRGMYRNAHQIAHSLWSRFATGEIG